MDRDDPIIRLLERNGIPGTEDVYCPICGESAEKIFKDRWGDIVGCDNCIEVMDALEVMEDDE